MRDGQEKSAAWLRNRLSRLDSTRYRRWPRWTNDDYIAVKFLLDFIEQNCKPNHQLAASDVEKHAKPGTELNINHLVGS